MRAGGPSDEKLADENVQTLVDTVKDAVVTKLGSQPAEMRATHFLTQVVAGTNYFVRVHIGDGKHIHLRIYKHFSGTVTLHGVKHHEAGGVAESEQLEHGVSSPVRTETQRMNKPRDAISYVDPDTGYTMLPGTQRPDGTWRKPIRVKEGYTPQDEVPLYESKGKAIAKAREGGHIPGLGPAEPQYSASSGYSAVSNFKIDTFVLPSPVHTIPGLNTAASPIPITAASKSKKKKKSSNQSQVTSNGVSELSSAMSAASITEKSRTSSGGQQPVATDPAKKLRNLKKKLRDIEALEAKLSSGEIEKPEPEQLEKVARKTEVVKEITALEKQVQSQG